MATAPHRFDIDLAALAERAKADIRTVGRMAIVEVMTRVVQNSPVGNPDRWKGPAPKGYVGGRFKNNWFVGTSEPVATTEAIDRGGNASLRQVKQVETFPLGGLIFMTNSLPYAYRLEMEGWSKAAPEGMVRKAAAEFSAAVAKAAAGKGSTK